MTLVLRPCLISGITQVIRDYLSLSVVRVDCFEFVDPDSWVNYVIFARTCAGIRVITGVPVEVILINLTNSEGSMQMDQLFAEEISNHAEIALH
ncbi:unnamed protein product [Lasius platythorax]|uniref:Uncharacterized protein n=1 Tax=Lasius platythorax TaxID=488582 RepID=A0AAV2NS24_9HYME